MAVAGKLTRIASKLRVAVVACRQPLITRPVNTLESKFLSLQKELELSYSRLSNYEIKMNDLAKAATARKKMSEKEERAVQDAARELTELKEQEEDIIERLSSLIIKDAVPENLNQDKTSIYRCPSDKIFLCTHQSNTYNLPEAELNESKTFEEVTHEIIQSTFAKTEDIIMLSNTPAAVLTRLNGNSKERVFLMNAQLKDQRHHNYKANKNNLWLTQNELCNVLDNQFSKQLMRIL